jgi:hypothetical protein
VEGDQVTVNFDGWSDHYDYTDSITHDDFHYVGYSEATGRTPVTKPGGLSTVEWAGWPQYLADMGTKAVPIELLSEKPVFKVAKQRGSDTGGKV